MISNLYKRGILTVLRSFYRDALSDRLGEIVFSQETALAIIAGVALVQLSFLFPHSAKLLDVSVAFLSYAAIALGFCVGGVTIALTLPDRDFVVRLATLRIEQRRGDALSGLFFVFCWTAVVHWIAIVVVLIVLLVRGQSESGVLGLATCLGRTTFGIVTTICFYALMQFLITVLTLWQVGRSYIRKLQADAAIEAAKDSESLAAANTRLP